MLLRKEHLSGWTLSCTPHLHAPLQRAHLTVLKATRVLALQELEDRLGLKPGVVFKQLLHVVPDINERIWPGPPAHRRWQLTGQPLQAPVLPRRLGVHSCLGRRNLLAFLCLYQRKQPPNLPVCDQYASAPMNRNTLGLIVVGAGILFVVDRYFYLSPVNSSTAKSPIPRELDSLENCRAFAVV